MEDPLVPFMSYLLKIPLYEKYFEKKYLAIDDSQFYIVQLSHIF